MLISPFPFQSPKTTPPKTDPAKRADEDESGKSPQTTPSNVAVVSPMPSLKKQKMQKAAAATTAEEKEKLNNSNNNKASSGKILLGHHLTTCFPTFQAQAVQKQPSCEEGDEGLKSLVPMKPLFGGANGSDTQDAASGMGEGRNVQLFFLIPKSPVRPLAQTGRPLFIRNSIMRTAL